MIESQHEEQHPADKLKLTRLDVVLETVIALILLTMWGMVLVSLLCPGCFPEGYDRNLLVYKTFLFSFAATCVYHRTRSFMKNRNVKEITGQRVHLRATLMRLSAIILGVALFSSCIIGFWSSEEKMWDEFILFTTLGLFICVLFLIALFYRNLGLK